MKIILSGGGTLGPVVPLLAIREAFLVKQPEAKFIWVGTKYGPEKEVVETAGVPFFIIGSGKWRRYVSLFNISDVFKIMAAFFQSLFFLFHEKPDLLISAGGFVSVPLHWAGALLAIPEWVHQQDVRVGLANKLMFPVATKVTAALRETMAFLPKKKSEWIGNPSRDLAVTESVSVMKQHFNIPAEAPVIFALGGGTGSASINKLVLEALPHWPTAWHVIHLIGRERPRELAERAGASFDNYHVYQFFTVQMKEAYAVADVIIARAGFATLTEVAALSKAAVILPMYRTHQEENAKLFASHGGIELLPEGTNSGLRLAQIVKDLIEVPEKRVTLGQRLHALLPRAEPGKIVEYIERLSQKS